MIILEGIDGSGKTSLAKRLCRDLGLPIHERASHSITGPVPDPFGWAEKDIKSWYDQPLSIYDRHPMISEFIYGPIVRGTIDPRFHQDDVLYNLFCDGSLVIFCDVTFDTVIDNLEDDEQMFGVIDHAAALHLVYRTYALQFAGMKTTWDYTVESESPGPVNAYEEIKQKCLLHMNWWENENV